VIVVTTTAEESAGSSLAAFRDIGRIDTIYGDGVKRIWDSEIPVMKKLRTFS